MPNTCQACALSIFDENATQWCHLKYQKIVWSSTNYVNLVQILESLQVPTQFLDSIKIEPRLFWESNSGKLVYGNLGHSLIYYTPGESELSKSPVTINLYFQYDHNLEDLQEAILSDSKKLWMLRQPPLRLF